MAVGTLVLGAGLVASDVHRRRSGGVTAMTVYSLVALGTAFGNVLALVAADRPERIRYFSFTDERYLQLALVLSALGAVLPIWGFWATTRWRKPGRVLSVLPSVRWDVSDRALVPGLLAVAAVAFVLLLAVRALNNNGPSVLGALAIPCAFAPHFVAFSLARAGASRHVPWAISAGALVALIECVRALLFDWARGNMALPLFAFAVGIACGARRPSIATHPACLIVFLAGMFWAANYGLIGEVRGRAEGFDKVRVMLEHHELTRDDDLTGRQTVLARLTTLNQLSQIGRVVAEDGFYDGWTMRYLAYAFIPRVFWPDKPLIHNGGWFALRIGQAVRTADGWYNNSVNMTPSGELYLNFGWPGVLVGLPLFGAFIGILWRRSGFWEQPRNVLGAAYGMFLMWTNLGGAGDFTVVVTLLAVYALFVGVTLGRKTLAVRAWRWSAAETREMAEHGWRVARAGTARERSGRWGVTRRVPVGASAARPNGAH